MDTFAGQRTKNELSRNALWYAIALVPLLVCPAHSWTCTFRVLVAQEDNTFSDAGMVCAPESAEEQASSLNVTVDSALDKFRSSFEGLLHRCIACRHTRLSIGQCMHASDSACFGQCAHMRVTGTGQRLGTHTWRLSTVLWYSQVYYQDSGRLSGLLRSSCGRTLDWQIASQRILQLHLNDVLKS
jgi:hypothetical protein